jgi:hypothetical protein
MVKNSKLSTDMGEEHVDIHFYRKIVGKLIYFTNARPKISMQWEWLIDIWLPHKNHTWKQSKGYLSIFMVHLILGLQVKKSNSKACRCKLGSSDIDTRRSIVGYAFQLGGSTIT